MSDVKITAELRSEFGKGAARRLRRADKVPAVLYGHGTDPLHLSLPGHDTMLALKTRNVLITLDIDGRDNELALPRHVQRHPLKGNIEHVDLLLVRRGEKVVVEVRIVLVGEPAAENPGQPRESHCRRRGRGHPPAGADRGLDRGCRGRHADPRPGPRPSAGGDAGRRRGPPRGQRQHGAHRRRARGRGRR